MHQGKNNTGKTSQEDHHYPFAGAENARFRLGVISREGGSPVWMQLETEDEYLARVCWLPDGRLTAQFENREQTSLKLVSFDPDTGSRRTLVHEVNEVWINLHHMFRPLKPDHPKYPGGFIWASERTGYQHLYLFDKDGNMVRALTEGEWVVDQIVRVDQDRDMVYFTGTRHGPTEKHLYTVPLDWGKPRKLTQCPGTHQVVIDPKNRYFVDTYHSLDQSPVVNLCSLSDGKVLKTIFEREDPRVEAYSLSPPNIVTMKNSSGHQLYGAIYYPPKKFGKGPFPTVISVYGGPHSQRVTNSWGMAVDMRAQHLCSHGFLVFVLDNRGSARRGLAFEAAIKHHMGSIEVEDQVVGVKWLVKQGLADPERVGVYGWSYGGYMAAMCLAKAPGIFKVAVAGAPVTHWDGYDTHYTERYMGTPQSNPAGYQQSSVMHYASNIEGKICLVHGLLDENVHFRHTARLINALIAARKSYDLLLFPDERHMPQKFEDRVYMEEQIAEYFLENL